MQKYNKHNTQKKQINLVFVIVAGIKWDALRLEQLT